MAKALFGSIVAPHELRVAEENAALRARVRRLEAQLALLQKEHDAGIARELLGMAEEPAAASALASTSA
jgi:cell division protein FtsB